MEVMIRVPGTCGELIQGKIDGINLHITCPVDLYTYANVRLDRLSSKVKLEKRFVKAKAGVQRTLEVLGYKGVGLKVDIASQLALAKGMASSSADLIGAIIGTMLALGEEVDMNLVIDIALGIEPTDGAFLKGIVAFDHLEGRLKRDLGCIDSIPILIFDEGGEVDTLDFNDREELVPLNLAKEGMVREAFSLVERGLRLNDNRMIGEGATLSSLANQEIIFKPSLDSLLDIAKEEDGILGVNVAHSGTLVGVILNSESDGKRVLKRINSSLPNLAFLGMRRIVNGGYKTINNC